jgi:hypothetical protein
LLASVARQLDQTFAEGQNLFDTASLHGAPSCCGREHNTLSHRRCLGRGAVIT